MVSIFLIRLKPKTHITVNPTKTTVNSSYLYYFFDGIIHRASLDIGLGFDAQQLHILVPQYRVTELPHVERLERLQRLYELQHVVPLSVEYKLTEEQDVVRVVAVDDAGFTFEAQLGDVQLAVVQELQRQPDDVLFAEGKPRRRHDVTDLQSEIKHKYW